MNEKIAIKDIEDISKELKSLNEQFHSFYYKMLAVAMDYKSYIDPNARNNDIYKIRDDINYRLQSAKFHFELLMKMTSSIDKEMTLLHRNSISNPNFLGPQFIFEERVKQVSYISDSIFFHLISGFDYVSNLVEYICGGKKKKDLKWTQLKRSARDNNNSFSSTTVAKTIDRLDKDFVSKLYDHRSHLIHSTTDKILASLNINLMQESCKTHIYSSASFNNKFKELKDESKSFNLTIQFSLLWVIRKSISSLIDILFSLKDFMEKNKKVTRLFMFTKGPNGEMLPVSIPYWKDNPDPKK
jgi:hypothetical protein